MGTNDPAENLLEPKARKACINCRRQKMKCRLEGATTCKRCRQAGIPCVFVPRANAAKTQTSQSPHCASPNASANILQRLAHLEALLGIDGSTTSADTERIDNEDGTRVSDDQNEYLQGARHGVINDLRKLAPGCVDSNIWKYDLVRELWSSFDERMPELHFMPGRLVLDSPCPLLLASMLYCSSLRGSADVCHLAPQYFTVLCHAMSQLMIPNSAVGRVPDDEHGAVKWAFQTILAILLAGLLSEATTEVTGVWISMAYRLILEHCPASTSERLGDWRKLFSGVQIVDLEHASIHLLCPVVPIVAPLQALQTSPSDQLARLSRMMHAGLTHFAGRRLQTIWSCFIRNSIIPDTSAVVFSTTDAAVIRDWARQLDAWLVEFSGSTNDSQHERELVFRQYILHRLTVLSIYHLAHGCDLGSQSLSAVDQHELLLSARAALRLRASDESIWSNWDLIMISWAALIVLQGLEGGLGDVTDLDLIKAHIAALQQSDEVAHGLPAVLVPRLLLRLEQTRIPDFANQQQRSSVHDAATTYDCSWQIFDHENFQHMSSLYWGPDNQTLTL